MSLLATEREDGVMWITTLAGTCVWIARKVKNLGRWENLPVVQEINRNAERLSNGET